MRTALAGFQHNVKERTLGRCADGSDCRWIGRLSWRVLRRQGIGGVPVVLVVALILIYFLQPWLDAAYQQAGLAGKLALVFFTAMLAILALLPKAIRDNVLGNFCVRRTQRT